MCLLREDPFKAIGKQDIFNRDTEFRKIKIWTFFFFKCLKSWISRSSTNSVLLSARTIDFIQK